MRDPTPPRFSANIYSVSGKDATRTVRQHRL